MLQEDHLRANIGFSTSKSILMKAGCDPNTIFWNPPRGTHPCATVRIGKHLDSGLKTFAFDNLYVSDASTFPLPLVRPPTLTIIGQSKRLAKHLVGTTLKDSQQKYIEQKAELVS